MTSAFTPIDWIVLIAYFAGTLGIGAYFYNRARHEEGYTAANRSLPGWICGLSIFATFLSSISYLALPGKSFAANWNPFVFSLSIPIVAWIAVRYFLPYYRNSAAVSAYALLEQRFGLWARIYASVFYLLTQIARIGVVLYLMALPMQVIFGWDIYKILIVTGISVTLYSLLGGILAVIWNDAIQAIVLMAGALICLAVMIFQIPGGMGEVVDIASDADKFSLGSFGPNPSEPTFWVVLAFGIAINLQNFGIDQSYIQRYIASSSDREARRSIWVGALLYVPVSALFFLIGTTLFAYYQPNATAIVVDSEIHQSTNLVGLQELVARQQLLQAGEGGPETLSPDAIRERAAQLTPSEIGDRVFPHFIANHLPSGLRGLLIAAIFAAAMSTVSTSLNSSATLLMSDFYKRFANPDASPRATMQALYTGTIAWGILGTGLALSLVRLTESALDIWWTLSGILGGGMSGLFLLGLVSRRARNAAAIAGVTAAVALILWLSLPKLLEVISIFTQESSSNNSTTGPARLLHAYLIPVFGTATLLLVGLAVSRFTGQRTAEHN